MVSQLVTIDATEPLEKFYEIMERDGGVIVRDFLSPELLKETMDALEPHFKDKQIYDSAASHGEIGEGFFPYGSIRIYALLARIPGVLTKILRSPIWQGIMGRFLNDEFSSYTGDQLIPQKSGYMLGSTAAMRLVPGAKPQPLHRDQLSYLIRPDPSNPFYTPMVGCLIAGSKCTQKNGATAVIPGSHLWPNDRIPRVEECTYAEMEPGSAFFSLGATYHGAGENKCDPSDPDALRTLIAVFGQRDYFRQDQEEILSTPVEIARTLPDDILRIAGYYKAVSGVGFVEEHQHPAEFLQKESGLGSFGKGAVKVAL